jgi:hypothetical protein
MIKKRKWIVKNRVILAEINTLHRQNWITCAEQTT